jgi:uncharacterized protein YbgA (DUF1722 family)/uncharacterized protein YbbK (DUF523 family)
MKDRIRLGISACLLGEKVRYDGGHKLDPFLRDTLGRYVEYVPVCPEVGCGLPVPREAMRLVGDPSAPRLVTVKGGRDLTEQMTRWARRRVEELAREGLSGFIFKARSPSSALSDAKVYNAGGVPVARVPGLFARAFMERFPLLPVEDDGRLHDAVLRERFIESLFTCARWRQAAAGRAAAEVVEFHTRNKLLLMSHSPRLLNELGRLVAAAKALGPAELRRRYEEGLVAALRLTATPAKHANALQHAMGYFKRRLTPDEKAELLEVIGAFQSGLTPLIVPVTLLAHYVRKYDEPYLKEQSYLHPHPLELQLRNHV